MFAQRVRAAWRVRACATALAVGAQVFLLGTGVAMPLCLNAAWLAALSAVPASALLGVLCRKALSGVRRNGGLCRAGYGVLAALFLANALLTVAALAMLGEYSLIPHAQATHSLPMTLLFALLCACSGAGAARLSFALRWALPVGLAALGVASVEWGNGGGLFPILGTGLPKVALGAACMLAGALPVLLLLDVPPEIEAAKQRGQACPIPPARFFVWRVTLGAVCGVALLFLLSLGSTVESIAAQHAWGARLLIRSHSQPVVGLPQTGLTVLQMIALLLLAAQLLQSAAAAVRRVFARGQRREDGHEA